MRPGEDLLQRLYRADPTGLSRIPAIAIGALRVLVLGTREFLRDNGLQWAASISFTTLLALVPLSILGFALLGTFEELLDLGEGVERLLLDRGLPDAAAEAGEEIRRLSKQAGQASTGLGIVGVGFLVITALGLFSALERAFNRLWKIRRRRSPFHRFRAFWMVITLGPALFGVSVYVTAWLAAVRSDVLAPVLDGLLFGLPFVLTWVMFFVFYVYLPNTRVQISSAVLGAVLAGSAWEVAKWGFNEYVSNAVDIDRVYGALGILPIFVLWIYLTWIIILVGVEICYTHQHQGALAAGAAGLGAEQGATRELTALGVLLEVYRPFRDGRPPPDVQNVARALVIRAETTGEFLEEMIEAGLILRDSSGLLIPGRDASRVTLAEALAAVRGEPGAIAEVWSTPAGGRIHRAFLEGEERRREALAGTTLDDVLAFGETGGATSS